jgi:hypothetical protein
LIFCSKGSLRAFSFAQQFLAKFKTSFNCFFFHPVLD